MLLRLLLLDGARGVAPPRPPAETVDTAGARVTPLLEPQAAPEAAAAQLIRTELLYKECQVGRQFDGRPPPAAGDVFVSVWSDGRRESAEWDSLAEEFGVAVTLTIRLKNPRDRQVRDRDDLERRLNRIRTLLHADAFDQNVVRLAGELGGRSNGRLRHVNFQSGMRFTKFDPIKIVGGDWFSAGDTKEAGLAQTAYFFGARLIQNTETAR